MNKKISVLTIISLMASNIGSFAVNASSRSRNNRGTRRTSLAREERDRLKSGITGELKTPPSRLNCQVGTYERGDKCVVCTGKPESSVYKDNHCNWSCNDGFIQSGSTCVKKENTPSFTKEEKLEVQKKMTAIAKSAGAVKNYCTRLDQDMTEVYNLLVAASVVEGLGTAASVSALGTNIVKEKARDADNDTKQQQLNNATTGLMAGSAVSGVIGIGTSGAATHKLDKEIKSRTDNCRKSIEDLRMKTNAITAKDKEILAAIKAGDADVKADQLIINNEHLLESSKTIVNTCDAFINKDAQHEFTLALNLAKSTVGLGTVGTLTSIAGTVTSAIAGTDTNANKRDLDLSTNILAGISTGTHGAATVTGSISAAKINKLKNDAKACQDALNNN